MSRAAIDPGSFRDRESRVFFVDDRVYRGLSRRAAEDWEALSATRFFSEAVADGRIVGTELAADLDPATLETLGEGFVAALSHQRIPFLSYPYEWCFSMLQDATLLQLDLLIAALGEGMILKDASAYNVQFVGARPTFIDVPSFERLSPGEPWAGYLQLCQLLLYPLLLNAYKDVSFQPWLRGSLEGINPADIAALMSWRDLLRPGVLTHVVLQAKLQGGNPRPHKSVKAELADSGFGHQLVLANANRLRKLVAGLRWRREASTWADYVEKAESYDRSNLEQKKAFVGRILGRQVRWPLVWDLGCNTGTFSRLAAERADSVVAIDGDHLAIERLYRELRGGREPVLPLVGNLADLSPARGFRGLERQAFDQRGQPSLTLALAVVHHLVISANLRVRELIDWLAGLGGALVPELVTKDDPMVRRLLVDKRDHYEDYEEPAFRRALEERFAIVEEERLASGTRVLFFAVPRSTGS